MINAIAPLESLPLYVRAGSIVPLGPDQEWSTEKAEDPIELRIYRGADGDFTLYEDENDTYNYEKGAYATIPLHWDDAAHTLTIGDRKGQFPGMQESRSFRVVFVRENHGVGANASDEADKVVQYSGKQITVTH
jgi:alpha-D-xyloside xylohydrolase